MSRDLQPGGYAYWKNTQFKQLFLTYMEGPSEVLAVVVYAEKWKVIIVFIFLT